jgi:hypothetical protein
LFDWGGKMDSWICHECIGDNFLKQRIQAEGDRQICSYCGKEEKSVDLSTIAKWLDPVFRKNYVRSDEYPTSDDNDGTVWNTTGESPDNIISEMLDVSLDIANDIVDILYEWDYDTVKGGELSLYDHDSTYDETPASAHQHVEKWELFCYSVKHKSRFYNTETTQILNNLLSNISSFKYYSERPPIRNIGPGTDESVIYRARYAKNEDEIVKMKFEPHKELGPPPKSKATSGRMNPQGIPVFYGSMDKATCISEIRLPVGGNAVLAQFEILKPILVLDLTVFSKIYDIMSYFDPEFESKVSRLKFLREFDQRISEPVLANENEIDYVPTQAFAEYLADHYDKKIDAVIYSSSQMQGKSTKNIVILPHAASVEWPRDTENDELSKRYRLIWREGFCHIIDTPNSGIWFTKPAPGVIPDDYYILDNPTLRVVKDSIKIVKAKSITYDTEEYDIYPFKGKDPFS